MDYISAIRRDSEWVRVVENVKFSPLERLVVTTGLSAVLTPQELKHLEYIGVAKYAGVILAHDKVEAQFANFVKYVGDDSVVPSSQSDVYSDGNFRKCGSDTIFCSCCGLEFNYLGGCVFQRGVMMPSYVSMYKMFCELCKMTGVFLPAYKYIVLLRKWRNALVFQVEHTQEADMFLSKMAILAVG